MKDIRFDGNLDFIINSVGFVSVMRDKDFTFEYKDGKKKFSFIYVEKGMLDYTFEKGKKSLRIKEGELLYIPKNIPYKTKYLNNNTVIKIFLFDINTNLSDKYSAPFVFSSDRISNIYSSITASNSENIFFLLSKIYEIFYYIQRKGSSLSKNHKKILPALKHITENYFENYKISFYAELCNMSESNFRKLFKEETGKSPIDYRNTIRISQVKKMTDSGEYSISEAAYTAGFNNMSFFYEVMKKEV